jgi:hypothetical protein
MRLTEAMANPKDLAAKVITGAHRSIFRATGGRVLGKFGPMPVVDLHTTGRKTGKARSTMLTAPIAEDDQVVLVASWRRRPPPHLVPQPA